MSNVNAGQRSEATTQFDLVIIGGGMVGASLACTLMPAARRGQLKVAVIERHPLPEHPAEPVYQPSYDDRSSALSYGSRCLLQQLGVWDALKAHVTPIEHIHVSDRGGFGATRLHAAEHGIEALGYVLENAWLGRVLLGHFASEPGITYFSPATVTQVSHQVSNGQGHPRLTVEHDDRVEVIDTQLAVIADGGRSPVSKQLHLEMDQRPYHQSAIIANVSTDKPHHNVAYERFTPQGPLALLPLHEAGALQQNRCALVFTTPDNTVDEMMALEDEAFLAMLQQRFGYRLGHFSSIGKRDTYPLVLQRAKELIRPGVVVMGNAAQTLHPVAGQGFNLALRGVISLVKVLEQAVTDGKGIGSLEVLQGYVRQQQADQDKTMLFTDQLIRLFGSDHRGLTILRDLGLLGLDLLPPAKQLFARQAMGLGNRLPRLT